MRLKGAAAGQVLRPRSARALFSLTRSPSAAPGPGPAQERGDPNAETPAPARCALPPDAGEPVGPGLPGQEPGTGRDRETQRGCPAAWVSGNRGAGPARVLGPGTRTAFRSGRFCGRAPGLESGGRAGPAAARRGSGRDGTDRGASGAGCAREGRRRGRAASARSVVPPMSLWGTLAQPRGYLTH